MAQIQIDPAEKIRYDAAVAKWVKSHRNGYNTTFFSVNTIGTAAAAVAFAVPLAVAAPFVGPVVAPLVAAVPFLATVPAISTSWSIGVGGAILLSNFVSIIRGRDFDARDGKGLEPEYPAAVSFRSAAWHGLGAGFKDTFLGRPVKYIVEHVWASTIGAAIDVAKAATAKTLPALPGLDAETVKIWKEFDRRSNKESTAEQRGAFETVKAREQEIGKRTQLYGKAAAAGYYVGNRVGNLLTVGGMVLMWPFTGTATLVKFGASAIFTGFGLHTLVSTLSAVASKDHKTELQGRRVQSPRADWSDPAVSQRQALGLGIAEGMKSALLGSLVYNVYRGIRYIPIKSAIQTVGAFFTPSYKPQVPTPPQPAPQVASAPVAQPAEPALEPIIVPEAVVQTPPPAAVTQEARPVPPRVDLSGPRAG